MNIADIVKATRLSTPEQFELFHKYRQEALNIARSTFDDRAGSYNVDHEPTDEMPYGIVSLASEIFKRGIRTSGLLTPLRGSRPLRDEDLARIEDTAIDLINYSSWLYAMIKLAKDAAPESSTTNTLVDASTIGSCQTKNRGKCATCPYAESSRMCDRPAPPWSSGIDISASSGIRT